MTDYTVVEMAEGEEIDSESGPIDLHLEPAHRKGEVHIGEPSECDEDGHCAISGNTYQKKDIIKKLPYGDSGTKWTGETWTVAEDQTANLAAVLTIAAVDVSIDAGAVASDPDWGYYHEQEQPDEDDEPEIEVDEPGDAAEEKVMVEWVATLVELGYYDSETDYADRHGVDLFWEDGADGSHPLFADTDSNDIFDTRKASPVQA